MNIKFFILVLFVPIVTGTTHLQVDPIVELPNGKILGLQTKNFANTSYYSFQEIPYAAPPIGPLRFKAPQPPENWDGILNATVLDTSCYQLQTSLPFTTDSEDCLFLNVYTPQLPGDGTTELLPVMLYIHGGAFMLGSSYLAPPDLFMEHDVILVSINYRLGPFGFLSTEDEIIPGNNGLKDQQLAIQWTHDNIHLFGGDPEKITIFGESAGAFSVGYHLLNQNSLGLFRAAILQSGTSLCPSAYQRNARSIAFGTAAVLNSTFADSNDSQQLLEFLQSLDAEQIDAAAEQFLNDISTPWGDVVSQGLAYAPVIEVKNPDAFITKKMYGLLEAGSTVKVPIILGFNSEESLYFNQDPDVLQTALDSFDSNLDLLVPNAMQITDPDQHAKMAEAIRDIYTEGNPFGTRLGDAIRYASDNSFNRGISKFAQMYSSTADTFFYQFSYDGVVPNVNAHYDGPESVGHGEDVYYLFCMAQYCDFTLYSENDQITSDRLIKLWTNFAKYLNPTPEPLENITWPKVSTSEGDFWYLDINETLEIRNHPKRQTIQKWYQLYDSLNFTDFDTY